MVEPEDLFESDDGIARVARFGPVFAGIFKKGLTAKALDGVREWQGPVMPDAKIFSFSLSFAADRLAPDTRTAADRLLGEFRDQTAGSATVLRTFGFEGSAARAMLATIYLLTRAAYPRKVFSNLVDAEAWLTTLHPDTAPINAAARWLAARDTGPAEASP